MPPPYPAFLLLTGREAVVVGGGAVAQRKARALLRCGARVTVIAPIVAAALARRRGVSVRRRAYRTGDLKGAALAFAATDDRAVNARVARDARRSRIPVNVADDPRACDFHVPAVARRGPLTIAVGTSGASPALAAAVRDRLAAALPDGIARRVRKTEVSRRRRIAVRDSRPMSSRGPHELRGPRDLCVTQLRVGHRSLVALSRIDRSSGRHRDLP
ncbi:MAG: bifunctional precorrin-2 dehydrogenase/sirohydrochlorin ferrochelatase [Planctomycetes bacterium]|nr:bifunctional precorrin-2 dehydrogenase/sirohydrochlorin ferrochelatase [Planctomycetota bacterium]